MPTFRPETLNSVQLVSCPLIVEAPTGQLSIPIPIRIPILIGIISFQIGITFPIVIIHFSIGIPIPIRITIYFPIRKHLRIRICFFPSWNIRFRNGIQLAVPIGNHFKICSEAFWPAFRTRKNLRPTAALFLSNAGPDAPCLSEPFFSQVRFLPS